MNGYAQLKSRILSRDEKAIGTITMPRAMLAGGAGGATFMVLRMTPLSSLSIPAFFAASVFFLWLFGMQQGLPRWQFFLAQVRSHVMLSAYLHPTGLVAQGCLWMRLDPESACVSGAELFPNPAIETTTLDDVSDWRFVDQPLAGASNGYRIHNHPGIVLQ